MTEPMKTAEQYPSTTLEKEAVQYVANDDLAMFANDDTRMIYEHYYIKGYEKAVAAERERIKNAIHELPVSRVGFSDWEYLVKEDILKLIDSL